ncbi:uncharacterized protein LOC115562290 [Drosophila navojoa]|nr:uncharacterized protein LOC115562290 [Drosophila navojoa]
MPSSNTLAKSCPACSKLCESDEKQTENCMATPSPSSELHLSPLSYVAKLEQPALELSSLRPKVSNGLATPWQSEVDDPSTSSPNATKPPSLTKVPKEIDRKKSSHKEFSDLATADMESQCIQHELNLTIEQLELLQEILLLQEDRQQNYSEWSTVQNPDDPNPKQVDTNQLWRSLMLKLLQQPHKNGDRLTAGDRTATKSDSPIYLMDAADDEDIDAPVYKTNVSRMRKRPKRKAKVKNTAIPSGYKHRTKRFPVRDREVELMRMTTRWPLHWPSPRVIHHMNRKIKKKMLLRGLCGSRLFNLPSASHQSRPNSQNKKARHRMHKPLLNQPPFARNFSEFWFH